MAQSIFEYLLKYIYVSLKKERAGPGRSGGQAGCVSGVNFCQHSKWTPSAIASSLMYTLGVYWKAELKEFAWITIALFDIEE